MHSCLSALIVVVVSTHSLPAVAQELATSGQPIQRSLARAAERTATQPEGRNDGWDRVRAVAVGTPLLVTLKGSTAVTRQFLRADDDVLLVVDVSDPSMPRHARRSLLDLLTHRPDVFAVVERGGSVDDGDVRLTLDALSVGGRKVANGADVLQRFERSQVAEIRQAVTTRSGSGSGAAVLGAVGGAVAGRWIGPLFTRCRCDDPGLLGAIVGLPFGALLGGIGGYIAATHPDHVLIYRDVNPLRPAP